MLTNRCTRGRGPSDSRKSVFHSRRSVNGAFAVFFVVTRVRSGHDDCFSGTNAGRAGWEHLLTRYFEQGRASSWPVLVLTMATYTGACVLVSLVLFQGRIGRRLGSLYAATDYLIHSTLIGGLVCLALTGAVIFGVARCRMADVGWRAQALVVGMFVTLALWIVMHGILALTGTLQGQLDWNTEWNQSGTRVFGGVLGQLLGNALVEELVFRGFLLPQIYLKAVQRFRPGLACGIAILASSVLYSVTHVPNLLFIKNMVGFDLLGFLVGLTVLGSLLAAAYVVTGNLFIAVGLHALVNNPAPLFDASETTMGAVWVGLTVVLLIVWRRIKGPRGLACDGATQRAVAPPHEPVNPSG
jgi:uncharacterized protein